MDNKTLYRLAREHEIASKTSAAAKAALEKAQEALNRAERRKHIAERRAEIAARRLTHYTSTGTEYVDRFQ